MTDQTITIYKEGSEVKIQRQLIGKIVCTIVEDGKTIEYRGEKELNNKYGDYLKALNVFIPNNDEEPTESTEHIEEDSEESSVDNTDQQPNNFSMEDVDHFFKHPDPSPHVNNSETARFCIGNNYHSDNGDE
ncbi:MAG: hypothetical protein DGJ47_000801 [Rickettsiaceae bacterium]